MIIGALYLTITCWFKFVSYQSIGLELLTIFIFSFG